MNTDKFGRSNALHSGDKSSSFRAAAMFPKTREGNYDLENLKLCNVGSPTLPQDCVNKAYVDKQNQSLELVSDEFESIRSDVMRIRSNLENADKKLQANIQELYDTCQEINDNAAFQSQMFSTRLADCKNKATEELSVKYDEKLKSIWSVLEQLRNNIVNTEEGLSSALAEFPNVENAINTLANQITENVADIRAQLGTHFNQMAGNLQINNDELEKKIQSNLRVYLDNALNLKIDKYSDKIDVIRASVSSETREREKLAHKLDKEIHALRAQFEVLNRNCKEHFGVVSQLARLEKNTSEEFLMTQGALKQIGDRILSLEEERFIADDPRNDQ